MNSKYSVSFIVMALLFFRIYNGTAVIYILPADPVDTPCPSGQNTCFTLNEWIESRLSTHPITNGTTVMLLSGIHFINSTFNFLLIENVPSIAISGQLNRDTIVECNYTSRFGLKFYNVREVNISYIQIKSCTVLYDTHADVFVNLSLAFIESQNVMLTSVKISNGGVLAEIYSEEVSMFQINNSMLSYSSFAIQAWSKLNICMEKTTIQNIPNNKNYVLEIAGAPALNVSFTDVTFLNNAVPLRIGFVEYTEFKGHFQVSKNSEDGGVTFYNCIKIVIYPDATIEFSNNNVRKHLLHIFNNEMQNVHIVDDSKFSEDDKTKVITFVDNAAKSGGIMNLESTNANFNAMDLSNTQLIFKNNSCVNSKNSYEYAAVLLMIHTSIALKHSNATFSHNHSPLSGGITLISSRLSISRSSIYFERNEGTDGGGVAIYDRSMILCTIICHLYFDHNIATRRGGAIFVDDVDYVKINAQDTEYHHSLLSLGEFILNFSLNRAGFAGDDIYGGWIDSISKPDFLFLNIPLITLFQGNSPNTVTSNPTRICMCSTCIPLCNITEHQINIFPGETFEIEAVAVGQRIGIVPSTVNILESPDEGSLSTGQDVQSVGRQCTILHFTVNTLRPVYKLMLRAQDTDIFEFMANRLLNKSLPSRFQILFRQLNITVIFKNCPLGYVISQKFKKCLCSSIIDSHSGVGCDLETYSIIRDEHHWLHATSNISDSNNQYNGQVIIIHDHCPYDYCRDDTDSLNFNLEAPDKQCAFSRSGILCGECQANLSQVFGTSNCKECSSFMAFAIIPITIVAGMLLVGLLMVLNFTVSTGTINGLIFYANIVRANQAIFFPARITTSFLSTFIAWLNLDLGIEVCFYNGLDAYAKTWLQFIFPFYIWFMLITIIIICYYSTMATKWFGKNPVQVLATLFLLSYAKIIRVVIIVFSYTVLTYSDGFSKKVWLYDGNVEFLSGKHTVLFIVTFLIFVLLSVPYMVTLVSIQWLQQFSHYCPLFWVNRLMPLFDAYIGPYKSKHRYWTGLLLFVRVIFLPIFSANFTNNPAINLLAVTVMSSIILTYLSFAGGIYKSTMNNVLEIASVLNLLLLSSATLYILFTGHNRNTTSFVSTGSAFIIFIILVLYHAGQQLMTLKGVIKCKSLLVSAYIKRNEMDNCEKNLEDAAGVKVDNTMIPTHTELCRPLIDC